MAQALFARIRRNPRIGSEGPCYPAVLILGRPSSHPGSAARLGARRWLVRAAMALAALAALGLAVLALSQIDVGAVAPALAGADPALPGVAVDKNKTRRSFTLHYTVLDNMRPHWREFQAIHVFGSNVPLMREV